jgi:phage gpG-like protein
MAQTWQDLTRHMRRVPREIPDLLLRVLDRVGAIAEDEARANASGRVLQRRSGELARSIRRVVEATPQGAQVGLLAGSSQVRYARIHEVGGVINGRPWLVFQVRPGEWRQVERVIIPARPYLRPAMEVAERALPAVLEAHVRPVLRFEGTP